MNLQQIKQYLLTAYECSLYLAPREPGLTFEEVYEIGQRAGLQKGEIRDALSQLVTPHFGQQPERLLPDLTALSLHFFAIPKDPEFRSFQALDFVCSQFNDLIRAEGGQRAQIERGVLVERALAHGIPRLDAEAAITVFILTKHHLVEKDGHLRSVSGHVYEPLPSQQRAQSLTPVRYSETRQRLYEIVKDVIARRTDGRPQHAEPLDAFLESLDKLGFGRFRLWWAQTVAELRQSNPQASPVAALVLAAALVEGALAFVVKYARDKRLAVFASKDFDGSPRTWKIDDLVASAARGGDSAILDEPTRMRAVGLINARQRIHAGRMLSEFPTGSAPDLRPDEARDAKATAEQVVRRVLDWLERYPPA
ncbi:MAG: hypothetical protein WAN51_01780 [Alphaproteobacteria bacterium]